MSFTISFLSAVVRAVRRGTHIGIACCVGSSFANSSESVVSWDIPALYVEKLEPLLTRFEAAKAIPVRALASSDEPLASITLLEDITWINEDGTRMIAVHEIIKVESSKASVIETLRQRKTYFSSLTSRVHVALARTILPDGTIVPIDRQTCFIQKSPEQSEQAFSDSLQLVLLFPKVQQGCWIERIVIRVITKPTQPAEFTDYSPLTSTLPVGRKRTVFDLPEPFSSRLQLKLVGTKPAISITGHGGRKRWDVSLDSPSLVESRDLIGKEGPLVLASTMSHWDGLGKWYADLLAERSVITEAMIQAVDECTRGMDSVSAKANAIYEKVSRTLNYTALEFGKGAYQPRAPGDVWATGFGDCKDTANVLRLMLGHAGIPSRIALLNTEHVGYIDQALPMLSFFDHAILAIDLPGQTAPLFCDPTRRGPRLGRLSSSSQNRPALLIAGDGKTAWTQTPSLYNLDWQLSLDLRAHAGGVIEGWVELEEKGDNAATFPWNLERRGPLAFMKSLEAYLPFPSEDARYGIIDFRIMPSTVDGSFKVRAYLIKRGSALKTQEKGLERIDLPYLGASVQAGEAELRNSVLPLRLVRVKIHGGIEFPEDWELLETPPDYRSKQSCQQSFMSCVQDSNRLVLDLSAESSKTELPAAEHPAAWKAQAEVKKWSKTPLLLRRPAHKSDGTAPEETDTEVAKSWTPSPESLPTMPTVEGQIRLIEFWYPLKASDIWGSDLKSRTKAYARLAKDFPENVTAQFQSALQQAIAPMFEFNIDPASAEQIIKTFRDKVPGQEIMKAELLLAGLFSQNERHSEAIGIGERLLNDPVTPELIQQGSLNILAASYNAINDRRAGEYAMRCLKRPQQNSLLLMSMESIAFTELANQGDFEELETLLLDLLKRFPQDASTAKAILLEIPNDLVDRGQHEQGQKLAEWLSTNRAQILWEEDESTKIKALPEFFAEVEKARPAYEKIAAFLKAHPWPKLDRDDPKIHGTTASDFFDEAENYEEEPWISVQCYLRGLAEFGPQSEIDDHVGMLEVSLGEWLTEDEAPSLPGEMGNLIALLSELRTTGLLDKENLPFVLGLHLKYLCKTKGEQASKDFIRSTLLDQSFTEQCRHEFLVQIEIMLTDEKQFKRLLQHWRDTEPYGIQKGSYRRTESAFLLSLALEEYEEAWRLLEKLADLNDDIDQPGRIPNVQPIYQSMYQDPVGTKQWWKDSKRVHEKLRTIAEKEKLQIVLPTSISFPQSLTALQNSLNDGTQGNSIFYDFSQVVLTATFLKPVAAEFSKLIEANAERILPGKADELKEILRAFPSS